MSYTIKVKPYTENNIETILKLYQNHSTYHEGDCGYDLFALEQLTINPGETKKIHFGISCESEFGFMLVPRSSISKTPLRMANSIGIIDAGYRGEIMAAVDNIKNEPYTINEGDRLFQLVAPAMKSINIEIVNNLSETTRGSSGFGSTNNILDFSNDSINN